MPRVTVEIEDTIAYVRLTRADKHNGVDLQMIDELNAAGRSLKGNKKIRAVILHGEGPSFCAGLDVKSVLSKPARAAFAFLALFKPTANRFQNMCLVWRELSVPVIAAIHGNCFGAGLQLALGADIRLCTPDAKLSVMEAKWGLIPDMAGTVLLRDVVSKDVALDLTFSARIVSGQEAAALGLVTRVETDPLGAARELVEEIRTRSPDAVAAAKHLFGEAWGASEHGALAAERRWQRRMFVSKNQRIATARNAGQGDKPYATRQW